MNFIPAVAYHFYLNSLQHLPNLFIIRVQEVIIASLCKHDFRHLIHQESWTRMSFMEYTYIAARVPNRPSCRYTRQSGHPTANRARRCLSSRYGRREEPRGTQLFLLCLLSVTVLSDGYFSCTDNLIGSELSWSTFKRGMGWVCDSWHYVFR